LAVTVTNKYSTIMEKIDRIFKLLKQGLISYDEAKQQVLDLCVVSNVKRMYCLRKKGKCPAKILICGAPQSVECPDRKQTI